MLIAFKGAPDFGEMEEHMLMFAADQQIILRNLVIIKLKDVS